MNIIKFFINSKQENKSYRLLVVNYEENAINKIYKSVIRYCSRYKIFKRFKKLTRADFSNENKLMVSSLMVRGDAFSRYLSGVRMQIRF